MLPVRAGTHGGAGGLALVPGHALGHVRHGAVHRYQRIVGDRRLLSLIIKVKNYFCDEEIKL